MQRLLGDEHLIHGNEGLVGLGSDPRGLAHPTNVVHAPRQHVPRLRVPLPLLPAQLALLVLAEGVHLPTLQQHHRVVVPTGYLRGSTGQGDFDRVPTRISKISNQQSSVLGGHNH